MGQNVLFCSLDADNMNANSYYTVPNTCWAPGDSRMDQLRFTAAL